MRIGMVLAVVMSLVVGASGGAWAQVRTIAIDGTGVVHSVPDMAVISLGAAHQAKTAKEAMDLVNASVSRVFDSLQAAGIQKRDVQTTGISLNPVYDRNTYDKNGPLLIGFSASNQISIRVRDLERVGDVLGDLVSVGANDVNGIRFDLREPRPLQDEARKRAVADARDKAELLAEAAGVRLGRIISINESGSYAPRPEMMRAAAMSDSVPVAAGELSIQAQVHIVWELAD